MNLSILTKPPKLLQTEGLFKYVTLPRLEDIFKIYELVLQNDTKHAPILANGRYSPSDIMYLVSDIMYFKHIILNMCPKSVFSPFHSTAGY